MRRNVYNFHMPWEEIAQSMAKIVESEDVYYLPHRPETFANVVLFSLRFGDVVNLNKWSPQAKPRPHVVLKVPCALVINKYRFGPIHQNAVTLKRKCGELVEKRYPNTKQHLPEHERDGVIPEAAAQAVRVAVQPCSKEKIFGVKQKHATPVSQKEDTTGRTFGHSAADQRSKCAIHGVHVLCASVSE